MTVRGRVRAIVGEPLLVSPVRGTACVAWRLVGRSESGLVDDATMTDFAIEADDGGEVRIRRGPATLAIAPGESGRVTSLSTESRGFLVDRLIEPDDDSLRLAEATLAVGDLVVVHAATEHAGAGAGARGFRVSDRVRVVTGTVTTPLHIERTSA